MALGGYVRGESDLDIVAVCRHPVDDETKQAVVEQLLRATAHCPARGLEFTLYRLGVVSSPPNQADFEVNVNGGPGMPQSVHQSSGEQQRFWFVLDRAIAHCAGIVISGPPPGEVFATVDLRHGRPAHLDEGEVDRLLDHVERVLARATSA